MSAIAGIVARTGGRADAAALERMMGTLRHRSRRRMNLRTKGAIAFGCGMSAADEHDIESDCDGRLVTFDGKLTNRDALLPHLDQVDRASGDGELILTAYRRWDLDCVTKLDGAFAFVLWDPAERRALCARDPIGHRPFFYHVDRDDFAFASEAKALVARAPALAGEHNLAFLADYMAGHASPADETILRRIRRLPPGHYATVRADRIEVHRYWRLAYHPVPEREDVAGRFAALLGDAVRHALPSSGAGAMLSGGLDSSTICRLAADMLGERGAAPLATYSLVYPGSSCPDERPFIDAVTRAEGIDPRLIDASHVSPLADLETLIDEQDGPILAPNHSAARRLYGIAAGDGVATLLDGHGGDETVSFGAGRLIDLIRRGAWWQCWRLLKRYEARSGRPAWPAFRQIVLDYGPVAPDGMLRRMLRGRRSGAETVPTWARFLNRDLAHMVDVPRRCTTVLPPDAADWPAEQAIQYRNLASSGQVDAIEVLDRAAVHAGIETRFPFLDRALIEYSFSLPAACKFADGHTRLILRRAMADRLPPEICWRADKYDFMPHVRRNLAVQDRERLSDLLLTPSARLAEVANVDAIGATVRRLLADPKQTGGVEIAALWRAASLATWLERGTCKPAHDVREAAE